MRLDGRAGAFRLAARCPAGGIGMVHQELAVVRWPERGRERPSRRPAGAAVWGWSTGGPCGADAAEHLAHLGIDLDPRSPMGGLPLGLQQLVEVARVLFSGARIIILDEPTSALAPPEVERLFSLLRRLRDGRAMHRVHLAFSRRCAGDLSDRVTVFRNGHAVATEAVARRSTSGWIIDRMIGAGHEELEESYLADIPSAQPAGCAGGADQVEGLSRAGTFQDVSLAGARRGGAGDLRISGRRASWSWRARCSACCRRSGGSVRAGRPSVRLRITRRCARRRGWRSCRRAGG